MRSSQIKSSALGLFLVVALPAAAETFRVEAQVTCLASQLPNGDLDANFPNGTTRVPCAGVFVAAMDSDFGPDEYCGGAFADSRGRVNFQATCGDDINPRPEVYLKVTGISALGFSVGTHDYSFWRALADVVIAQTTAGLSVPEQVMDFLRSHASYEWLTGEQLPAGPNATLNFGTIDMGAAQDNAGPISDFAARQIWALNYTQQRLGSITSYRPMFARYSVDAPLGTPTTIWDTVIIDEARSTDTTVPMRGGPSPASAALIAAPHELGHVLHNTIHGAMFSDGGFHEWLADSPAYITNHAFCETNHAVELAWYEGFGNWIGHLAYGSLSWPANTLIRPPVQALDPCPDPGFHIEGNVTRALDLIYYGPLTGRLPIDDNTFLCDQGFTLVGQGTPNVRCQRVFGASCPSSRTRRVDAHGDRDTCTRPRVSQMTAAQIRSARHVCLADRAPCPPMEEYVYVRCLNGTVAVRVGVDACTEQRRPADYRYAGGAPRVRGDGTPDSVVGHSVAGNLQWMGLPSADAIIGMVAIAGVGSHSMEVLWARWGRPACTISDDPLLPLFCHPTNSRDFTLLGTPLSPGFFP